MAKRILCLSALLLMVVSAFCQVSTKLDLDLLSKVKKFNVEQARVKDAQTPSTAESVTVAGILNKGAALPENRLNELGIKVISCSYGVAYLSVPVSRISALEELDAFCSFEMEKESYENNKIAHTLEHVDELQDAGKAVTEGLPGTYTGEGVVVGIYDRGIDFNHVFFRDPETKKTRIKEALVFRKPKYTRELYTNEADIDTLTTDWNQKSHGTHVASIAAGSYNGDWLDKNSKVNYTGYRGVAYKADLVLAGTELLGNSYLHMALTEMDRYATSVGKPLVINISSGMNGSWLDGKTVDAAFLDSLTDHGNRPGRVVCIAAGNQAYKNFCIYKQLDESNDYTVKTLLPIDETKQKNEYFIYVPFFCNDTTTLEPFVDVVDSITGKVIKTYNEKELKDIFYLTHSKAAGHNNRDFGRYEISEKLNTPLGQILAVRLKSKYNKPCKVRMYCTEASSQYPFSGRLEGYTEGDKNSSICETLAADGVLGVGSWNGNDQWRPYLDPDSTFTTGAARAGYPFGSIAMTSSYCLEDDNGKAHPDFAAPGMGIVSGYNSYDTLYFDKKGLLKDDHQNVLDWQHIAGVAPQEMGRQGARRSYIGEMHGTSMASPNAAGVVALWLQANPQLTANQIREVIRQTADNDEFTAKYAPQFGAGKINALAGLKYILQHYPTGINDLEGNSVEKEKLSTRKVLIDGRMVILKDGKRYNTSGMLLKQ